MYQVLGRGKQCVCVGGGGQNSVWGVIVKSLWPSSAAFTNTYGRPDDVLGADVINHRAMGVCGIQMHLESSSGGMKDVVSESEKHLWVHISTCPTLTLGPRSVARGQFQDQYSFCGQRLPLTLLHACLSPSLPGPAVLSQGRSPGRRRVRRQGPKSLNLEVGLRAEGRAQRPPGIASFLIRATRGIRGTTGFLPRCQSRKHPVGPLTVLCRLVSSPAGQGHRQ